jgi:hypothetical protein
LDQPQEKPPLGTQDDAALLENAESEPLEQDENVDSNFSVLLSPHEGQATPSLSALRKHKNSKTFPHFLHLNS